jgi:hypothetical protein
MSRRSLIFLLTVLVVGLAMAQHWEFEQVDTAQWGLGVQMRRLPDGRLCLSYRHPTAGLRYAVRDTIWHYEDIGPGGDFGFSVTLSGVPAVLCGDQYIERTDTGWVRSTVPWTPYGHFLAHDSAGSPVYIIPGFAPDTQMLIAVSRVEGVWQQDTAVRLVMPDQGLCALAMRSDALGRPMVLFFYYVIQGSLSYEYLNVAVRTSSGWVRQGAGSTMDGYFGSLDLTEDAYGNWGAAFTMCGYMTPYYLCYFGVGGVGPITRSSEDIALAVALDSQDRAQVFYEQGGRYRFAWRDSTEWDSVAVPWNYRVEAVDMVTSDRDEPVVAFYSRGGLWLACASNLVGCAEMADSDRERGLFPSIGRRELALCSELPAEDRPVLLDITGRRVMSLQPGVNDIRRVAPGVYFVREGDSRIEPSDGTCEDAEQGSQGSSVRKIVIQR